MTDAPVDAVCVSGQGKGCVKGLGCDLTHSGEPEGEHAHPDDQQEDRASAEEWARCSAADPMDETEGEELVDEEVGESE